MLRVFKQLMRFYLPSSNTFLITLFTSSFITDFREHHEEYTFVDSYRLRNLDLDS